MRSKFEQGAWYCNKKADGCGANFGPGTAEAQAIESQDVGRIENPDVADVYNTCLKMAKKRAHVDATLSALAVSDAFTQDIEDLPNDDEHSGPTVTPAKDPAPGGGSKAPGTNPNVPTDEAGAAEWRDLFGKVNAAINAAMESGYVTPDVADRMLTTLPRLDVDRMRLYAQIVTHVFSGVAGELMNALDVGHASARFCNLNADGMAKYLAALIDTLEERRSAVEFQRRQKEAAKAPIDPDPPADVDGEHVEDTQTDPSARQDAELPLDDDSDEFPIY
jgi:hypothetical protein